MYDVLGPRFATFWFVSCVLCSCEFDYNQPKFPVNYSTYCGVQYGCFCDLRLDLAARGEVKNRPNSESNNGYLMADTDRRAT